MVDKASTTKPKRLPKGERAHTRRLKAVARKAGTAHSQAPSVLRPPSAP
jgi:hypothetical protein